MLQMIPHSQGKRSSPAGGRTRSSCGYHHQRHQACPEACDGRKNHPLTTHSPVRDKFSIGCGECQKFFQEHSDIPSPLKRYTSSPLPHNVYSAPSSPEQQLPMLPAFNSMHEDFGPVASPRTPPARLADLARIAAEPEQQYLEHNSQPDLVQIRQEYEREEQTLLQYRQQLDQLRQDQEMERQRIQQYQHVIDYQKQQQDNELRRIQQYQRELESYQLELDDARRDQELQRQILNKEQIDLAQSRADLRIFKKQEGLTSSAPAMYLPFPREKSHSPNPTTVASHSLDEENSVRERKFQVTTSSSSNKRPISDVMGYDSEEVSHKSNSRRTG